MVAVSSELFPAVAAEEARRLLVGYRFVAKAVSPGELPQKIPHWRCLQLWRPVSAMLRWRHCLMSWQARAWTHLLVWVARPECADASDTSPWEWASLT